MAKRATRANRRRDADNYTRWVRALESVDTWPCENVAAACVDTAGATETYGPTDASFPLASVTKLLTAAAVLIAFEEGTVALDAPEFEEGATLAELLSHAAGLSPDGQRLDQPGRRRVYSNAGYELAADAVALGSEMDFATYVGEAILRPLGMTSTTFDGSPAHGARSCVDDLVAFIGGRNMLLSEPTLERMTTPHLPELIGVLPGYGRQEPNPWGLGPEIRGHKSPHWTGETNSPETWGHFGQSGTFLWVDPEVGQTLIVLTDRSFGNWAIPLWPALSDAVRSELLTG